MIHVTLYCVMSHANVTHSVTFEVMSQTAQPDRADKLLVHSISQGINGPFEHTEFPVKVLDYFLRNNESDINQSLFCLCIILVMMMILMFLYTPPVTVFVYIKPQIDKSYADSATVTGTQALCRVNLFVPQVSFQPIVLQWASTLPDRLTSAHFMYTLKS